MQGGKIRLRYNVPKIQPELSFSSLGLTNYSCSGPIRGFNDYRMKSSIADPQATDHSIM
jgi:hypothetical protein